MTITRKLALLVAVPLVAVVAFAALAVATSTGSAMRAEQLRQLVATGAAAGELVHRLQVERAAAVLVLTTGTDQAAAEFAAAVPHTRDAATALQRQRQQLPRASETAAALLDRASNQLPRLAGLRDQVAGGRGAASAVAFTYRILIADLISFRESVPQAGGAAAEVADRLRAAAALSQAIEHLGRQQVAVLRAVAHGSLTPAAAQEVTGARTGHADAGLTFDALAPDAWRSWWERSATGGDAVAAQRLQDQVARTPAGVPLRLDAEEWTAALGDRMQRLREVEAQVDAGIASDVTALRDAQRRLAAGQSAAVTVAVAIAVALAIGLGRPVVRGLRRLRDAAHRVAYQELPAAVSRLDDHQALGGLSPDEFADQAPAPVRVHGRDELAEVGQAFNAVHREAVRTAAGQALLRVHVAAMFVNLARRGQNLAGRLTTALDEAERDERDPGRLAQLFELDLLVTLLGRTNDSLLVLGGAAPAQVRTADEPMSAVLAAAQSQVEAYARVEIGLVDNGVAVRAPMVDDVVKLLAELLDNGCTYSPPDTVVRVDARWLSDRVLIQAADAGIGIAPGRRAELNARLASRPELDLVAVRAMGLTVVGHIAARHGIRVELRPGHDHGTIAEVTLPPAVFTVDPVADPVERVPRQRTATVPPLPARRPEPATQELRLPVFEQVRSQWFTSGDPSAPATVSGVPAPSPAAVGNGWHSPADVGWAAAARAASPTAAGATDRGLPKRRPGAQFVPGGVERPAPADPGDWRDPAQVSAALTAYSRGLASGRARHPAPENPTEWSLS